MSDTLPQRIKAVSITTDLLREILVLAFQRGWRCAQARFGKELARQDFQKDQYRTAQAEHAAREIIVTLARCVIVAVFMTTAGCGLTDLLDDEPGVYAYADVGYPITAYLAQPDSIPLRDGVWIEPPNPAVLRWATRRAIERWSKALSATEVRVATLRAAVSADNWHRSAGDTLTGLHILIRFAESLAFGGGAAWLQMTETDNKGRPVIGVISLNARLPWDTPTPGWLENMVVHEIGHALGFRKPFDRGVVDRVNEKAGSVVATRLPVEGHHWERCMRPDVMTPTVEHRRGQVAHISNLTIEAMTYPWRYNEADVEKVHGTPPACWREAR